MDTGYSTSCKLLINEPPIVLQPSLAVLLGVNEALFVQQLHYWIQYSKHIYNDRKWVYNTYEAWQEKLPFISITTIKRIISKLKKEGILLSDCFNKNGYDRTLWYTLDYDRLIALLEARENNVRKQHKDKELYVDPASEQVIEDNAVPDNLKVPISPNTYKNPEPPVSDNEEMEIHWVKMAQWSGQNGPMDKNPDKSSSGQSGLSSGQNDPMDETTDKSSLGQNGLPLGQNGPMEFSPMDLPLGQNGPMESACLVQPIPLEYTEETKHKNTTTEESPPKSYPQASMNEDDVVVLKNKFSEEYELCKAATIDPKALLNALKFFPQHIVNQYLQWTLQEYKSGKLVNPTGWFLAALKQGYKYYAVPETEGPDPNMAEIIRRTEEDIKKSIDEYGKLPLPPESPFAKYIL